MNAFTLIAELLDLALEALDIPSGEERELFTLELNPALYGLCTIDLFEHRVFLLASDRRHTGKQEWTVYYVEHLNTIEERYG